MLAISKRVRRKLGLRAEHVRLLTDEDWRSTDLGLERRQMIEAIDSAMGSATTWGFKYAGNGRILPFWIELFEELGVQPAFALAYRNPLSIAASRSALNRARGRQQKTDLEWLANLVPHLHLTRDRPLIVVDYDRLIRNPVEQLERAGRLLDLNPSAEGLAAFARDFVSPRLQHSRFTTEALLHDRSLNPLVRRGALLLEELAGLDTLPDESFWTEWMDLRRVLYEQAPTLQLVDALLDESRRSRWWDVASPIQRAWQARPRLTVKD